MRHWEIIVYALILAALLVFILISPWLGIDRRTAGAISFAGNIFIFGVKAYVSYLQAEDRVDKTVAKLSVSALQLFCERRHPQLPQMSSTDHAQGRLIELSTGP